MSDYEKREWRFYLDGMIGFAGKAIEYTDGIEQDSFVASGLNYDATVRNLELLGEAATHTPEGIRNALHKIAQFRVLFILTACTLTLTSPVSAQVSYEMCSNGAKLVRQEKYSIALLEWRKLATDASQKSWLRVSLECLRATKLATTDEDAFRWMSRAAESSTFAKTQLALMYASGLGTAKDAQQALDLLKVAAAKGDEAAEFLLQILWKIDAEESNQSKVSGSN